MLTRDNILPIGSVITVDDEGKLALAIVGYGLKVKDQCFDYSVVRYPLGEVNDSIVRPVNAEDIRKVLFVGCKGPEDKTFTVAKEYLIEMQEHAAEQAQQKPSGSTLD